MSANMFSQRNKKFFFWISLFSGAMQAIYLYLYEFYTVLNLATDPLLLLMDTWHKFHGQSSVLLP